MTWKWKQPRDLHFRFSEPSLYYHHLRPPLIGTTSFPFKAASCTMVMIYVREEAFYFSCSTRQFPILMSMRQIPCPYMFPEVDPLYYIYSCEGADSLPLSTRYILTIEEAGSLPQGVHHAFTIKVFPPWGIFSLKSWQGAHFFDVLFPSSKPSYPSRSWFHLWVALPSTSWFPSRGRCQPDSPSFSLPSALW